MARFKDSFKETVEKELLLFQVEPDPLLSAKKVAARQRQLDYLKKLSSYKTKNYK